MIVLKSHVAFVKVWRFLYSCCLTWIEEKAGSFWLREGSASPSAALQASATGEEMAFFSNRRSWRLLRAWRCAGFVGQSGNLHRSGAGSIHRSIHYEHAPSLSSRRCRLQISARKKKDSICFPAWNYSDEMKQKWCKSLFQKFGSFAHVL